MAKLCHHKEKNQLLVYLVPTEKFANSGMAALNLSSTLVLFPIMSKGSGCDFYLLTGLCLIKRKYRTGFSAAMWAISMCG